ncbi:MAG: hypothetical protein VYE40_11975 [Myxococcota bacterium]|nr:hypothetical protein [Myxococcota bacterium]
MKNMAMYGILALLALAGTGCELLLQGKPGEVCPKEDPSLHEGETPTSLEDDCRCGATAGIITELPPGCLPLDLAEDAYGGGLGEGPSPHFMGARVRNGDFWPDRGEIIMAVTLGANVQGFVMALDVETGNRRVVSGTYVDPSFGATEVGEGPQFLQPKAALRGPDGMIYVNSYGNEYNPETSSNASTNMIHRIDPDTGDRELVWKHYLGTFIEGYGICDNGSPDNNRPLQLQLEGGAFEVAEDGAFFIGTIRNGRPKPAVGFIEVSADGKECRVVSMGKADPGNAYDQGVGGGYHFGIAVEAINHVNGQLFVMDNNSLLRVDRTTGMRERIMSFGYPGIMEYDAKRDLYHVTSLVPPYANGGFIASIDLNTQKWWRYSGCLNIDDDHPFAENCMNDASILNDNQAWLMPDGEHMITVNAAAAFSKIDLDTGVANNFSF